MSAALVLAPFSAPGIELLGRRLDVTHESWLDTGRLQDPDELGARLDDERVSVLVVESDFVFEETFEAAGCLRLVGVCRTSVSHIDLDAATRHGVAVVNAPGRNSQAVAEHALGLMLSLARGIPAADAYVRGGRWENPVEPYVSMRGGELSGRKLGVVGLGRIGRTLAGIGIALGMDVAAHDPYVDTDHAGVPLIALDELLAWADFVSLHLPGGEETDGLLDHRRLSLMRPTSYLINTSDAGVVDREPLVESLASGRLGGAGIDVFESHPVAPGDPLLALDNVVLTPHLGGATRETIERHSRMVADDVMRFLDGVKPVNLVNMEVWERIG